LVSAAGERIPESVKMLLRPWVRTVKRARRGELRLADLAYGHPSFSQFGEDRVLEQIFIDRPTGFYVDVGAWEPMTWSNTYLLYRRGWSGINLEPHPGRYRYLARSRPRDVTLPLAVSDTDGEVDFHLDGVYSGIADRRHQWGERGRLTRVRARPLASILEQHVPPGQGLDLLDVDCEGHDLTVLETNDWTRFRPLVVLAEWHTDTEVPNFLASLDYELLVRLRFTGIFVDRTRDPASPAPPRTSAT
jgi:FkbM family methyltransferase